MAWIRTIVEEDAEDALSEAYESLADPSSGRVDNILKIHSLHPAGLRAHAALYSTVMSGSQELSKTDRELVALVVSGINECHY